MGFASSRMSRRKAHSGQWLATDLKAGLLPKHGSGARTRGVQGEGAAW